MMCDSKLITLFISMGFIVPIIAVSKILMVKLVLSTPLVPEPMFLAVIGSLPVYLLDRVEKPEEDEINKNKSERIEIVNDYGRIIKILSLTLIITYVITNFALLEPWMAIVVQTHFILFIIYPKSKKFIILDTILVGVAWSVFLVSLVSFYTEPQFSFELILSVFISMFVMKVGETELSNIRDKESDAEAGHPTLPSVFSEERVIAFVSLCLITSFIILSYHTSYPQLLVFIIGSAPILYSYASYDKRSLEKTMYLDRLCKIIISSLILVIILL